MRRGWEAGDWRVESRERERRKRREGLMIERQEPVETGGRAHGWKGPT